MGGNEDSVFTGLTTLLETRNELSKLEFSLLLSKKMFYSFKAKKTRKNHISNYLPNPSIANGSFSKLFCALVLISATLAEAIF